MVHDEMDAQGIDRERLEVVEIKDDDDAVRLGFPGSPTILVHGDDLQTPGSDQPVGLNCRIYRRRDGRVSPLPDPEVLRDAFAKIDR